MQSIQSESNFSIYDLFKKEKFECDASQYERLEMIAKIAGLAISTIALSIYAYSHIKNFITSKLSSTEYKPISFEKQVLDSFSSIGIEMEKVPEESGVFRCLNCSFVHLNRAMQHLSEDDKTNLGEFYYSPERRSICCDFNKNYSIQYPQDIQWTSLLKASGSLKVPNQVHLELPHGSVYSENRFIAHPLFQNTLEKYSVFQQLCKLQSQPQFQTDYETFLSIIHSNNPNWADGYRLAPVDLAYLSLFAYLDAQITQQELFIVHMIASAFLESPHSTEVFLLSSDNIKAHLKDYFYLTQENETNDFYCLRNIDKKSLIERTAFRFQSREKRERAAYTTITKAGGANPPGVKLLSSSTAKSPVSLCILPPWLWKRLYSEMFPLESPPIEHEEFFGFRRRLDDLIEGRPISYASPLFYLPSVHGLKGTQLGVTVHDIMFHCLLDWRYSQAHKLIRLGQKIRSLGKEKDILNLAMIVLDRNVVTISENSDKDIARYLSFYCSSLIKKLSEENQLKFFVFCQEIFGKTVIEHIFSSTTFDQKFKPQNNQLSAI